MISLTTLKFLWLSLRPRQWLKNGFVFASLIFAGKMGDYGAVLNTTAVFLYFCLLASAMYLFNDVMDRRQDRLHPVKSRRPVAAGTVSVPLALVTAALLVTAVFAALIIRRQWVLAALCVGYTAVTAGYSLFFKRVVILDAMIVALGFELRVWAGSVVIGVMPSDWLQVCTFLLALFISFAKRHDELCMLDQQASGHRQVLADYNRLLLEQLILLCAGITLVAYILYTLSPEMLARPNGGRMIYSVPLVIYGICRYLYLIYRREKAGDPAEAVFGDKGLMSVLVLWVAAIVVFIYF